MKKKVLLSTLAMAAFMSAMPSVNAFAADDSKASAIYDFSGFNDVNLINLFYQVYQDGRKYPTAAEFAAAGIQQSDIAFIRSQQGHHRPLKPSYQGHLREAQPLDEHPDGSG